MNSNENFETMLARAKAGDEESLARLVKEYEPEVRLVARLRLGPSLRPHLDSIDLLQSVHRSLLVGLRGDRFDISTPEKLVALALTIVRRKVARQWRQAQRQLGALVDTEEEPGSELEVREWMEKIESQLDSTERQLIHLRYEGYSTIDVARKLAMDPDVLRVKLSRLRKRLREGGFLKDWL